MISRLLKLLLKIRKPNTTEKSPWTEPRSRVPAPKVNIFGCGWRRAAKEHTCWLCGETIAKGEGYFRTTGTVGGKMFSVKHCRKTCECTAEMLDQNPQLAHRVFEPTFKHEASV